MGNHWRHTRCLVLGLQHFCPGHSPKIHENNVAQIEARLVKESLLNKDWIDETINC